MIEALFNYCKCCIFVTLLGVVLSLLFFGKKEQNKQKKLKALDFKKIVSSLGQMTIRPNITKDDICAIC